MCISKRFGTIGWKGGTRLYPAALQGFSLQSLGFKVLIISMLIFGLAGFLRAQNLKYWDGGTIPIFDNHKSDQNQLYPDEVEYLHHAVRLGALGPTVDGVVIIDAKAITEVMLKWNRMYNEQNLNLARAIYADRVTYHTDNMGNNFAKNDLINVLRDQFDMQHPNFEQDIMEISGHRLSNTGVQIDILRTRMETSFFQDPMIILLERNQNGWQITSEVYAPINFAEMDTLAVAPQTIEELPEPTPVDIPLTPQLSKYQMASISSDAQNALSCLRIAYGVYLKTNGTTDSYTMSQALKDCRLGDRTLRNWTFSIKGNPPRIYMAESTAQNEAGAARKIWFDVDQGVFQGFGMNDMLEP